MKYIKSYTIEIYENEYYTKMGSTGLRTVVMIDRHKFKLFFFIEREFLAKKICI